MGVIYYFGIVGYPVSLFFCTFEVSKRLEISVIDVCLPVSFGENVGRKSAALATAHLSDGDAALSVKAGSDGCQKNTAYH